MNVPPATAPSPAALSPSQAMKNIATASVKFDKGAEALGERGTKPTLDGIENAMNSAATGVTLLKPVADGGFDVSSRMSVGIEAADSAINALSPQYGIEKYGQRIFIPEAKLIENADIARDRLLYASRVIDI